MSLPQIARIVLSSVIFLCLAAEESQTQESIVDGSEQRQQGIRYLQASSSSATCPSTTVVDGETWPTRYHTNDCVLPVNPNPARANATDINLVVMSPYTGAIGDVMTKAEPILAAAAQEIEDSSMLLGYRLKLYLVDTACNPPVATGATIQALSNPPQKHGLLASSCSGGCAAINDAARVFNVLQMAPVCTSTTLSDEGRYPNFIRFSPSLRWNVEASISIFKLLQWRRVGMVYENRAITIGQTDFFRAKLENEQDSGVYNWVLLVERKYSSTSDVPAILSKLSQYDTRIIFTSLYEDVGALFLCEAYNQGMYAPDYVWFVASGWWNANFLAIREKQTADSALSYGGQPCSVAQMTKSGFGLIAFDRGPMLETDQPHGRSGRLLRDISNDYKAECEAFANGAGMCQFMYSGYFYDALWEWAWLLNEYLVVEGNPVTKLATQESRQWLYEKELHVDFLGVTGRIRHFNDREPTTSPPSIGDRDGSILLRQLTSGSLLTTLTLWSQSGGFEWLADLVWSLDDASLRLPCSGTSCSTETGYIPLDHPQRCPDGFVYSEAKGCEKCPIGTFAEAFAQTCSDCDAGKYSSVLGGSACELCASGTFSKLPGAASCATCEEGSFANGKGSTTCQRCGIGTYQPKPGQSQCLACDAHISHSTTPFQGSLHSRDCVCPATMYYRIESQQKWCEDCPKELLCEEGLTPPRQAAFFHVQAPEVLGAKPSKVVRCANDDKCTAGRPLNLCPPNRVGIACDRCEIDFYEVADGTCADCSEGNSSLALVLSILIGLAVLLCIVIYTARQSSTQMFSVATIMFTLGVTANIVQTLGAFTELAIDWIEPLKTFKQILMLFTFRIDMLNPGCVFKTNSPPMKYLGSLLVVPACAFIILIFFIVIKYTGYFKPHVSNVLNALGLIWLILFLSLTMSVVLPWQCERNPDGSSSIASNRSVLCWEDEEHISMIILSCVAFLAYIVSFLAIVISATLRYPAQVIRQGGIEFLRTYRFIFDRFVPSRYYYGIVYTIRSFSIALLPVIFINEVQAQVLLLALVVSGFGIAQTWLQPWRTRQANLIDAFCTLCLGIMLTGGSMLVNVDTKHSELVLQGFLITLILAMFALIVAVLVYNVTLAMFPRKLFGVFLCHNKLSAAVLARWFKIMFSEQTTDKIFLDSDELDRLDLIFDTVATQTKNCVLIGTNELLKRMWCAGEVTSAIRNKVNTIVAACDDYEHPSDEFISSLSELWSDTSKNELSRLGVEISDIEDAYRKIHETGVVKLHRMASPAEQEECFTSVLKMCMGLKRNYLIVSTKSKTFTDGDLAQILITGNLSSPEPRTTCQVLQLFLQKHLQASIFVVSQPTTHQLKSAAYLATVLSSGVLGIPAFAATLVAAGEAKLVTIPIQADHSFVFPDPNFWEELDKGKVVKTSELNGVSIVSVSKAYKGLFMVLALKFSPWGSETIQHTEVSEMVPRFRKVAPKATQVINDAKAKVANEAEPEVEENEEKTFGKTFDITC